MIYFHSEDTEYVPAHRTSLRGWINATIREEGKLPGEINFIYCSDNYLHKINQEYLAHDDLTDIITFDYCEGKKVNGDIFISIDRVNENAASYNISSAQELHRVIIHGVLHLCGYKDKTPSDKKLMTEKEDEHLGKRPESLL